ncbi:toll/interleukin-1 receptor domain-containing protein [Actinosynnema sp. NPDC047251]|uniref:toll/interleukin-1 receptor domain-containing protein n=1 Tax=Saccharothrix espanaensis TaxID=103731 RepID=UPI00068573A0|nr:toll/interleukin-1 receptor domain-containing protein [Saccharothrix espanaensis]
MVNDPQFLFYLRQLHRDDLLDLAGKRLPVPRDQVFVCYSHHDADWLRRVLVHLAPLERDGVVDVWSDRRIRVGDQWRVEIIKAPARARAALVLISADSLASEFINSTELPALPAAAEEGGCRPTWRASWGGCWAVRAARLPGSPARAPFGTVGRVFPLLGGVRPAQHRLLRAGFAHGVSDR